MSKAFKCDRCKECFDPYSVGRERYFMTISEVVCQNGNEFYNHEVGYREGNPIHLCPSCSELINRVMAMDPDIFGTNSDKEQEFYEAGFDDGVEAGRVLGDILFSIGVKPSLCGRCFDRSDGDNKTSKRSGRSKKNL